MDKKDPLACFSMAIEGSCKRDNCTYSHDPSVLGVYLQEIMKSPFYKPRGAVGSSSLPKPFQKQHALSDSVAQREGALSDQLTILNLNFKEPSMAVILRQTFLNLHSERSTHGNPNTPGGY